MANSLEICFIINKLPQNLHVQEPKQPQFLQFWQTIEHRVRKTPCPLSLATDGSKDDFEVHPFVVRVFD